ncbi:hypothetical protein WAE59_08620 [Pedobacter sp. GR22-6]
MSISDYGSDMVISEKVKCSFPVSWITKPFLVTEFYDKPVIIREVFNKVLQIWQAFRRKVVAQLKQYRSQVSIEKL